jgi:hypothetical protein
MPIGLWLDHDDGGDDDEQNYGHFIKPTKPNVASLVCSCPEFFEQGVARVVVSQNDQHKK